jgi:spermidine/putrescine transport system ATP-binding protein
MKLSIPQGEFFTLLGPSGCGKTTTLRMIAGFEQPSSGEIFIEGQPVSHVQPNRRPVNTVFQNYALFPHLSVEDNVGFGLKVKRVPAGERKRRVQEALALVQLPNLGSRRPSQLSGGQQQRVALARALVNEPAVLLLDEPLGALDLKLRKAVQLELKHLQDHLGITFIYVTHDQEEALTMSNRIAVMNDGVVQQVGTPREIYEHPNNRFVADFIGETNFLPGAVAELGDFVRVTVNGMQALGTADGRALTPNQQIILAIRPEKINLYPHGHIDILQTEIGLGGEELSQLLGGRLPSSIRDARDYLQLEKNNVVLDGRIQEAIYIGTDVRYRVSLTNELGLVVRMQNFGSRYDTTFRTGDPVYVHWVAENAQVLTD